MEGVDEDGLLNLTFPAASEDRDVEMVAVGEKDISLANEPVDVDVGGGKEMRTLQSFEEGPARISFQRPADQQTVKLHYKWLASLIPDLTIISRRTVPPIMLYSIFSLCNSLFHTAMPLLAAADLARGGYGLGQRETALASMASSVAKLVVKAMYVPIHGALGTLWCYRTGVSVMIAPLIWIPMRLGLPSSWAAQGLISASSTPLVAAGLCLGAGEGLAYLAIVMTLTDSVPPTQFGALHGIAGAMASVVRTIGPTLGGAVWELAPSWAVFVLGILLILFGIATSYHVVAEKRTERGDTIGGH
ncbi:hypothetical protein HK101_004245 [Irineochytrium annulatum]|nr:hypothetical protein HK101_004245 [Irineochytrium annulatum]